MGMKISIRDTEDEQESHYAEPMYAPQQQYPMAPYQQSHGYAPRRMPSAPNRQFTETTTRHVSTNDPMLKLSDVAKSKGFNIPPVAIAAIGGAVAWGMFQQMVIAGAIAAGAYLFTTMSKGDKGKG